MRNQSLRLLAIAMASLSISAAAQEAPINKGDLADPRTSIDQSPVSIGDAAINDKLGVNQRTRITNASTQATDASTAARVFNGVGKDVIQQQAVLGDTAMAGQRKQSEFQKFVQEATGQVLPIYGSNFFEKAPSTFSPVVNAPVPADYPLGPGDEVLIRGWGSVDIDFRATIDRAGTITIPSIGAVVLSGVRAGEAESVVRAAVNRLYKGVSLSVSFGQLRAITVYVVGQASRPGTYTVSSASTLVTALFASGGPSPTGAMRHVQLKRNGRVVADLDLYSFIARGDKSGDVRLLDGDTIYIPVAAGHVALVGKVNNPAIYELLTPNEPLDSVLQVAGGVPVLADPRRAFLERLDPGRKQPRTVSEFALDAAGMKTRLKDGDLVNITSITPEFANAVMLRGSVDQSIRAPFKPGMRVTDLIPGREYLMTRASVARQNAVVRTGANDADATRNGNELVGNIGNLIDEVNWEYATVERIDKATLSVTVIPFNLGLAFDQPSGPDNLALQPGDVITVFSQNDVSIPMERRKVYVRIEGEVKVPGVYQVAPGETLQSALAKAGGPTQHAYLFGTQFYRIQARTEQEASLERVTAKLEAQLRSQQAFQSANVMAATAADVQMAELRRNVAMQNSQASLTRLKQLRPTGRIAFGLDPRERSFNRIPDLKLANGDRLVIPARPDFVQILGEVNSESTSIWRAGATVGEYLQRAGMTTDADADNIFLVRADGSVLGTDSQSWLRNSISSVEVMPGDVIVVPVKASKESAWTRFTGGLKEWAQILANFGLGAAAIKTLRD